MQYILKKFNTISEPSFKIAVLFLFLSLYLPTIISHEMWRDELQAWMISSNSNSISHMLHQARFEPHPNLWFLILYPLTRISKNPMLMQILNASLSLISVFLFLHYAPFKRGIRFLFPFGYYVLFEYAVISRCYSVLVLLLIVISILLTIKNIHPIALSISFICLINISTHGFILAVPLFVFTLWVFLKRRSQCSSEGNDKLYFIFIIICIGGFISTSYQLLFMPDDFYFGKGIFLKIDIERVKDSLETIGKGFFPLTELHYQFWNSSFFSPLFNQILGVIIIFISYYFFKEHKPTLILYFAGLLLLISFSYIVSIGAARHWGHFFIYFICCKWIAYHYKQHITKENTKHNRIREILLIFILYIHVVACFQACLWDWKYPFSASKQLAMYIKKHFTNEYLLIGIPDTAISPIAGYLQHPIYYPRGNRFATFVPWDKKRLSTNPIETDSVIDHALKENKDVVIISNLPIQNKNFSLLAEFTQSIVPDETYYVYNYKF